jgi:hypothetical protein
VPGSRVSESSQSRTHCSTVKVGGSQDARLDFGVQLVEFVLYSSLRSAADGAADALATAVVSQRHPAPIRNVCSRGRRSSALAENAADVWRPCAPWGLGLCQPSDAVVIRCPVRRQSAKVHGPLKILIAAMQKREKATIAARTIWATTARLWSRCWASVELENLASIAAACFRAPVSSTMAL